MAAMAGVRKGIWWTMDKAAESALERRTLVLVTSKLTVYFLFVMALLSGLLFIGGLGWLARRSLDGVPDGLLLLFVGATGFCVFFPWFLAAYIGRHLLNSVRSLERQIAELTGSQKPCSDPGY